MYFLCEKNYFFYVTQINLHLSPNFFYFYAFLYIYFLEEGGVSWFLNLIAWWRRNPSRFRNSLPHPLRYIYWFISPLLTFPPVPVITSYTIAKKNIRTFTQPGSFIDQLGMSGCSSFLQVILLILFSIFKCQVIEP